MKKLLFIALSSIVTLAHAGGGMTGGATEFTQIMNNVELVGQTSETIRQTSVQIQQLTSLQRQLQYAPGSILNQMGLPGTQLDAAMKIYGNVTTAKDNLTMAQSSLGRFSTGLSSIQRSAALANKELIPYLQSRIDYAQKNKVKLDSDIEMSEQAMKDYEIANKNYQASSATIPSLGGTTDNLQTLNQTMLKQGMMMAQANTLYGAMLKKSAMKEQREMDEQMQTDAINAANSNRFNSLKYEKPGKSTAPVFTYK